MKNLGRSYLSLEIIASHDVSNSSKCRDEYRRRWMTEQATKVGYESKSIIIIKKEEDKDSRNNPQLTGEAQRGVGRH